MLSTRNDRLAATNKSMERGQGVVFHQQSSAQLKQSIHTSARKRWKLLEIAPYSPAVMNVLEIVAENIWENAPCESTRIRAALRRRRGLSGSRCGARANCLIVDLCFEFDRETEPNEKENILRTLEEISADRPVELSTESIEEWEGRLKATDLGYAKADASKKTGAFLKAYFSLRAKAGLATQADVARKSGLSRSYVAVIESANTSRSKKLYKNLRGHSEWMSRP